MSEVKGWKCWRLWYQGPPGARGCYIYRQPTYKGRRPSIRVRSYDREAYAVAGRYAILWRWGYR